MAGTVISFIVHWIAQIADYRVWLHFKLQAYAKQKKKNLNMLMRESNLGRLGILLLSVLLSITPLPLSELLIGIK